MREEIRVHVVDFQRKSLYMRYRDPITGKTESRSTGTPRRREAERIAAKWEQELRAGRYKSPSRMLWREFRDQVDTDYMPALAENSVSRADTVMDSFEEAVGPQLLTGVTTESITTWQRFLRSERMLSESSIKSYTATLKAVLRWGNRVGLLPEAPAFPMPRRAKRSDRETPMKGRPITDVEFKAMLEATSDVVGEDDAPKWRDLLVGLWTSGLRIGEIVPLSWDDEDVMRVETLGRHTMLAVPAESEKANRDRLLPIAPEFVSILNNTPQSERYDRVFKLPQSKWAKKPPSVDTVTRRVSAIGKTARIVVSRKGGKVKFASAHDLRRSFGDRWSQKLMPADLQRLMRHASIETTLRYYVGRTAEALMDTLLAVQDEK